MSATRTAALASAALLAWAAYAAAEAKKLSPEDVAKAEAAVKKDLAGRPAGDAARVTFIKDAAVERALPGQACFAVLFPQYPVARVAPPGLSSSNVFVVDRDGKIQPLTTEQKLTQYVQANAAPAKTDDQAKDAARAYARLAQELHQDGFYKFELMDDATKVEKAGAGRNATAKVVVMQGGNGTIDVVVALDEAGKVDKAKVDAKLKPGPRPICQATKLLHPDPLVRRICEQDLLIMGPACLDYLAEQRARATPELQREIDRVRGRIERGER
jgi:hypothetical protein